MNLTIQHRNVKMNLVFASLIAEKLYQLETQLALTSATVLLEVENGLNGKLRIIVQLKSGGERLRTEAADREPGTALLKAFANLQTLVDQHPFTKSKGVAKAGNVKVYPSLRFCQVLPSIPARRRARASSRIAVR